MKKTYKPAAVSSFSTLLPLLPPKDIQAAPAVIITTFLKAVNAAIKVKEMPVTASALQALMSVIKSVQTQGSSWSVWQQCTEC